MARLLIIEDNPELASLMVAAAQSRGHHAQAVHTGEAALALLRPRAFDAAVVDLLLPDIRGSEVLTALVPNNIPAIAISGVFKGDRFAQEAVNIHGARAFFEKPFELDALLDALEQKCGLPSLAIPPPPPPEAHETEEAVLDLMDLLVPEDEVEELPALAVTPPPLPTRPREITSLPEPHEAIEPGAPLPPEAPPEPEMVLPFGEREKVWTKTAPAEAAPAPRTRRRVLPEWSLEGEIKEATVPRLLNAYYEARHNGELKLKQGQILKVIYFEAGRPVYAASNLANERFARFSLRRGVLNAEGLQAVAALAKENVRTSEAMIRLGFIDAERHRQLVEEQVKEILWSTFGWTQGGYGFSPMRLQRSGRVKLSIFPGDLLLEGVLRMETLVTLRQRMAAQRRLFPTANPPYALHELRLSGPQAMLLAYSDGSKTVEDLLTLTDLSERETLATLRGLELMSILEERREEPSRRRITFGL
ncbi:response regulator [Stigmatella sp. ncwal1]|uniref:Response regulator n=1 Tax=Stigmatella ashevillensis TaxID=2995309 RepID=A0ABT5D4Z3_9BACT|nr:response regulator [Stigmatella ashevillena]MDC0708129.1 response regulator [Stigmatella ashevillena]